MDLLRWLEHKRREICFSHNVLLIIAMFTMLLDHIAFILIQNGKLYGYDSTLFNNAIALPEAKKWLILYKVLRTIGRISFPIYCLLITEGFRRTSNVFKYILRILLLAILSEVPFDIMIFNRLSFPTCMQVQNVLFTFVVALIMLSVIRIMARLHVAITIIPLGIACVSTFFLKSDYWLEGIILIYVFYIFRHDLNLKCLFAMVIIFSMTFERYHGLGVLSIFFIYFYDGTKGYLDFKRFHYLFYPLHMLVLYGILFFTYNK